jgi:hypothetical protein
LKNPRLLAARAEVNEEVERCTHTAPKFSPDGKIAVFRIKSQAQGMLVVHDPFQIGSANEAIVHPVIATRWAGHLQSKALEIVMVANEDYTDGKVNFSCRIARCARGNDPPVNIIESLKAYARLPEMKNADGESESKDQTLSNVESVETLSLLERLGDNFARGHVQASGGIVDKEDFEELMRRMQIGVKPAKSASNNSSPAKAKAKAIDGGQKNTLLTYFGKPGAS